MRSTVRSAVRLLVVGALLGVSGSTSLVPAAAQTSCDPADQWCDGGYETTDTTTTFQDGYGDGDSDGNTSPTTGPGDTTSPDTDPDDRSGGADPYDDPYDADPYHDDPSDDGPANGSEPDPGSDPHTNDPLTDDPSYDDPYHQPSPDEPSDSDPYADPYQSDPYGTDPSDGYDPYDGRWYPVDGSPIDNGGEYWIPVDQSAPGFDEGIPDLPFVDPEVLEMLEKIGADYQTPAIDALRSRQDTDDDLDVADVEADEVPRLTAGRLVLVIDALAELGLFRRTDDPTTTSTIRFIRDVIPADGLTATGYRSEIRTFDAQLDPAIEALRDDGVTVGPALQTVAGALSPDLIDTLDTDGSATLDPTPWINALGDLVVRNGAAPAAEADRATDQSAVDAVVLAMAGLDGTIDSGSAAVVDTADVDTAGTGDLDEQGEAADAVDPVAADGGPGAASTMALILAAIVAVLLAAAGLGWSLARRRSTDHVVPLVEPTPDPAATLAPKLSVNDLLDASRRMTASLDSAEIGTIVMAEARRLVGAEGGLVVLRADDGRLEPVHHEPTALFRPEILADPNATAHSCLRRVVETGQATVLVAAEEPLLVEVPMAVAAVPLVVDGRVAGALLVVRVSSRPFDRGDVEALELLAPMVGTALQAATTHGSATELAETEPLTGLKNRRRLTRDLAALDEHTEVAYVMIDIDHFKNFNDTNGHAAGDEALRQVARALERSVRPGDLVYRYGGEEFCMLLVGATPAEAVAVGERARAAVEATDVPGGENQPSGRVTVSVGVACAGPTEALAERADAALYEAKRSGRNQVLVAPDPTALGHGADDPGAATGP